MRSSLIALAALLLVSSSSHAASYYLDPVNGNGSCSASGHSGCNGTACRSFSALQATVGTFRAGDVVNFCSGTFRETLTVSEDGASGNPIVFRRASGTATPELNSTNVCNSWSGVGSGVYACSFTPEATGCANGIQKLFVDRQPVPEVQADGCPAASSLPQNSWCYDGQRVLLHLSGNGSPSDHTVEVGSRSSGVVLAGRSNITIDGLTLFGAEGFCRGREYAIAANGVGAGITLTNNTLRFAGNGIIVTGGTSPVISNNTIEDMAIGWSYPPSGIDQGLYGVRTQANSSSLKVTGNTFNRLGTHAWANGLSNNCGVQSGRNTAVCHTYAISNQSVNGRVNIDDNKLIDIENGIAVKVDAGAVLAPGSSIARNVMRGWAHDASMNAYSSQDGDLSLFCEGNATGGAVDCTSAPTPHPVFREFQIVQNWMQGGFRGGILVSAADKGAGDAYSVLIANNIIVAGDYNFGNPQDAALWLYKNSAGIQVYNNTFQCERSSASGGAGIAVGYTSGGASGNAGGDFQNNIFDFANCRVKISDNSSTDTWNAANNLCDVAVSGRCKAKGTLGFLNAAIGDLRLLPGVSAAAIDQGSPLSSLSTDIDGHRRPSGAGWDIGASEVTSGPQPPTLLSVEPVP